MLTRHGRRTMRKCEDVEARRLDRELLRLRGHEMTDEEKRRQRLSFVYGNVKIENGAVTRAMAEEAAQRVDAEE